MRLVLAVTCAALILGGCAGEPPTASVGDCVDVPIDSPRVTSLVAIDCALEHDIEVFALGNSTVAEYDKDDVAEQAQVYCRTAFEEYVGISYEQSVLDIYLMYPDAPSSE